ncbi:MAG TPA: hypothetical protein VF677_04275 [Flavobacterium sp.]|jgi:hypothetical protein
MRYIVFLLCCLTSCRNYEQSDVSFRDLDYTYDDGWSLIYSLKLDHDGNFIIRKGAGTRWEDFKTILDTETVKKLDKALQSIVLAKLDTIYVDKHKHDAPSFNMSFILDKTMHSHYVYGRAAPQHLLELKGLIDSIVKFDHFNKIDTVISFRSIKRMYPFFLDSLAESAKFLPPSDSIINAYFNEKSKP